MWTNRITLDYIKHNAARKKVKAYLDKLDITDNDITNLNISTESGYVLYEIMLNKVKKFIVSDDGNII